MKTNLSKYMLLVCMVVSLISSGCGAVAPVPTFTPTIANTATKTLEPTKTLTPTATLVPTRTPKPTSTPDIAATQKYEGLQVQVEKLASDGVIPSVEGKYYPLDDYSKAFAKIRYYTWVTYDDMVKPANFIIQAKVKIANETTENANKSGCGFVVEDNFQNHAVFFASDGNANYWTDGRDRGSNYLDAALYEQNPEGITLTLVLYNKALLLYVNDRMAFSQTVYGGPFSVGPSVLSGTSEGFGTQCDFTEMGLWEIK